MNETYTPAQRFQLAAQRIEIERKRMREMSTTVRMRGENTASIMKELMQIVCHCFAVDEEELKSNNRERRLAYARHAYCCLCSKLEPTTTLKEIGRSLGRDHSTVVNSIRKADDLRLTDYNFAATFDLCLEKVAASNKAYMRRIKFHPEDFKELEGSQITKSVAALAVVHEFLLACNEHDLRKEDGVYDTYEFITRMQELRKLAIKRGL